MLYSSWHSSLGKKKLGDEYLKKGPFKNNANNLTMSYTGLC
jgi:hypothetical protein